MRAASPIPSAPRRHWPEYLLEASELALFMISASVFAVLLFHPHGRVAHALPSELARRTLMGLAMGATLAAIVYSPLGRRSGAHMNPATTLVFWRLGKVRGFDAIAYVGAQFAGGVAGTLAAAIILRSLVAHPSVDFVTTNPGIGGTRGLVVAWIAEFLIAGMLMLVVLELSNRRRCAPFTGLAAATLVVLWIVIEQPISGMSMNPARTFGSALTAAVVAREPHHLLLYFTAPPLGMLAAAEVYLRTGASRRVYCAKLSHPRAGPCIFRCEFAELLGKGTCCADPSCAATHAPAPCVEPHRDEPARAILPASPTRGESAGA